MSALFIPDLPPGCTVAQAATMYAAAGWYVGPAHPETKHPGSLTGYGWQYQTTRDPAVIAQWWAAWPWAALYLHVGRSGAVAFDVDTPGCMPDELRHELDPMPFQSTRASDAERGHYLAAAVPGTVGNSYGDLGPGWGDVRGLNGVIVVAPTPHSKAADGGRYAWVRTGALPPLPAALAGKLRPPGGTCGTATSDDVAAFLRSLPECTERCPLVEGIMTSPLPGPGSRYTEMGRRVFKLARLGEQGHYGASAALDALADDYVIALGGDRPDPDGEYNTALSRAVAAMAADPTKPEDRGCCGGTGQADEWARIGVDVSKAYVPPPVSMNGHAPEMLYVLNQDGTPTGQVLYPQAAPPAVPPVPDGMDIDDIYRTWIFEPRLGPEFSYLWPYLEARKAAEQAAREAAAVRRVVLTPASSIKPERVRWLWDGRLALGTLALAGGREGAGKSTLLYQVAADVTHGKVDGEHYGTPRAVIVAATEDDWPAVIVPRLMGAGANLDRVFRADVRTADVESALVLPYDLDELAARIRESGAVLVVLDPLMSRLDASLDSHKDADVRRALEPLTKLAGDTGACIAGIIHPNKSGGTDALNSLMGSRAFAAVARTVLYVLADPDDESGNRRLVLLAKSNLSRTDLPALAFEIAEKEVATDDDGKPITTGVLGWVPYAPPEGGSLASLLATTERGPKRLTKTDQAAFWLSAWLRSRGGRAPSKEAKEAGKAAGFSLDSLKRALSQAEVAVENTATKPRTTDWVLSDGSVIDGAGATVIEFPAGARARSHAPTAPTAPTGEQESINPPTTTHWPGETSECPVGAVGAVGDSPQEGAPTGDAPTGGAFCTALPCPDCTGKTAHMARPGETFTEAQKALLARLTEE